MKPTSTSCCNSSFGMNMSDRDSTATKVQENSTSPSRKYKLVYEHIIFLIYVHLAAIYGLYLCFAYAKWATILFGKSNTSRFWVSAFFYLWSEIYLLYQAGRTACIVFALAEIGITAGAHRLWAHKAYKANLPLQILLMLMQSAAHQYTVWDWVRNHRVHHKYSDTDADPSNASRGFFFSHIGWLLVAKHPDVKEKGQNIDISDILNNPVLMFQKKYSIPLIIGACFVLPTAIPVYCWGETWHNAWYITILRYVLNLNAASAVNSVAHMWGNKPYDVNIMPVQNLAVSLVSLGEGFHNYHHTFPWDYRVSELGNNYLNLSTKFIDLFAKIGWAYDLKTVSEDMIKQRANRTGDGSDLWGRHDEIKYDN